jgi:hypothetical protein
MIFNDSLIGSHGHDQQVLLTCMQHVDTAGSLSFAADVLKRIPEGQLIDIPGFEAGVMSEQVATC